MKTKDWQDGIFGLIILIVYILYGMKINHKIDGTDIFISITLFLLSVHSIYISIRAYYKKRKDDNK